MRNQETIWQHETSGLLAAIGRTCPQPRTFTVKDLKNIAKSTRYWYVDFNRFFRQRVKVQHWWGTTLYPEESVFTITSDRIKVTPQTWFAEIDRQPHRFLGLAVSGAGVCLTDMLFDSGIFGKQLTPLIQLGIQAERLALPNGQEIWHLPEERQEVLTFYSQG